MVTQRQRSWKASSNNSPNLQAFISKKRLRGVLTYSKKCLLKIHRCDHLLYKLTCILGFKSICRLPAQITKIHYRIFLHLKYTFLITQFSNKLEAVVYTFIVSQILNSQEKETIKELFQKLDKNHDGVISSQELRQALLNRKEIDEERINFLMRVIDTNNSGQIDFTQFIVAALQPHKFSKTHFEQAFAYFDIDHSGVITYD